MKLHIIVQHSLLNKSKLVTTLNIERIGDNKCVYVLEPIIGLLFIGNRHEIVT